ncbi:syntenin-1-like [Anthonomus grandis grandis]|uniref:syntenin-1-like n=1 Tax=Anthonomus grandis grandis TaxID=2921223 RepID=UPI0021657DEC|nr:syntenin-1-like [Anthonomus grandis grandis]
MSMYPSLEDMKMDQMSRAQIQLGNDINKPPPYNPGTYNAGATSVDIGGVYPSLGNYMGLELSEEIIKENMPEYSHTVSIYQQLSVGSSGPNNMIAPLSGQSLGLHRAQVTNGIREVTLCKDADGKVGVRVKEINNGIFIALVVEKSPAALAGLRFGDQILQINGTNVAGMSMEKVHNLFKKSPVNGIKVVLRDRPFERTLTLHKDSTGCLGFQFKNGRISTIIKDSSAARNGVLIDHQLLEVEGQNVVGLKDKQVKEIIANAGNVVTITVIPSFMYDHMVKKMAGSLLKGLMDHSIPSL